VAANRALAAVQRVTAGIAQSFKQRMEGRMGQHSHEFAWDDASTGSAIGCGETDQIPTWEGQSILVRVMSSPTAAPDLPEITTTELKPGAESTTEVYAIHGAEPEVLAYAMAKYSRSALTMRESLTEISSQKAEQFLNTFYFQYGHRSIADLAHIPFAVERLSLLAAITLVDETRWDGQERSTRYQDFRRSGWYTPELSKSGHKQFTAAIQALFHAYDEIGAGMFEALKKAIPQPEEMKPESYARTLKARAFDAARYMLPLATNTSLGQ